jgi:hypothetical protein
MISWRSGGNGMEAASAIVGGCIVVFVGKRYCCIVVFVGKRYCCIGDAKLVVKLFVVFM